MSRTFVAATSRTACRLYGTDEAGQEFAHFLIACGLIEPVDPANLMPQPQEAGGAYVGTVRVDRC
jgi:hypothetical protein